MAQFLELRDGDAIRLVNLKWIREVHYTDTVPRLVLHIMGADGEHIVNLEGPLAREAFQTLRASIGA